MKRIRKFKRNIFDDKKLSKWAKKVKQKDGFCCVACGYKGYLHSHHIIPKSKFPDYVYEQWNGVTLCKLCHTGNNGVHGKSKPRNQIVKQLRKLLKECNIENVKDFSKTFKSLKKSPKKPYYRPYKRNFKGKKGP